jgi:hypothetical protein
MGDVVPFRSNNYIQFSSGNLITVVSTVSFPWLEIYGPDGVTQVQATIDVKDIPPRLHPYLLVMMRTQKLVIPEDDLCDRCHQEEERTNRKPWWKWWCR